jgi:hypothetical protein
MWGRFSGQDYEVIERRIAQQDRVKPRLGPKRHALSNAEIERLRRQILAGYNAL